MKIRSKSPENQAYEARTISILKFALYALIPLALAFLMGFSISGAKISNDQNILESEKLKNKTIDSLEVNRSEIEEQIQAFYSKIGIADSTLNEYKTKSFAPLLTQLTGISDDVGFTAWDTEFQDVNKRLTKNFQELEYSELAFEDNTHLRMIFSEFMGLISDYLSINTQYFTSEKMRRKARQGISVTQDYEKQIEDLKDEKSGMERDMAKLEDQLEYEKRNIASTTTNTQKDVQEAKDEVEKTKAMMTSLKSENKNIQNLLLSELDRLDEIITNQFRIRDAHTKDDIKTMQGKINKRLVELRSHTKELTIK